MRILTASAVCLCFAMASTQAEAGGRDRGLNIGLGIAAAAVIAGVIAEGARQAKKPKETQRAATRRSRSDDSGEAPRRSSGNGSGSSGYSSDYTPPAYKPSQPSGLQPSYMPCLGAMAEANGMKVCP